MLSLNKFLNRTTTTILNVYFSRRLLHGECLNNRSLVKVCGQKTNEFLQGLITNDIQHLNHNVSSMYTMFLNVQGRVLFDVIIYKTNEGSYIIDCDSQIVEPLINHMKFYKVRRKIKFEKLDDSLQVWVVFDDDVDLKKLTVTDLESFYLSPQNKSVSHFKSKVDLPNQAIVSRDPRLKYLGVRIILPAKSSLKDYSNIPLANESYQKLRFKLGIGEGVHDLARGKCLPLEVNCDYLHGVNFQKGCYIGQELTARTYHTGVIRKRFMPLIFERDHSVEKNTIVTNEKGKNVGKVISTSGDYGIGLLRVVEALAAQSLNVGQYTVKTFKPGWWPIEVSKDS